MHSWLKKTTTKTGKYFNLLKGTKYTLDYKKGGKFKSVKKKLMHA